MPFVDFAELKTRVSIEQAMQMLGLKLVMHGSQYRGACPACQTGGDRALIVTPAECAMIVAAPLVKYLK